MARLGPIGYSPYPAAIYEGILNPPPGKALLIDKYVDEETAMREAVKQMLSRENPTIFVGPQVLYAWNEKAKKKAKLVKEIANVLEANIIPMVDYRAKYPTWDAKRDINATHPNVTIWQNNIKVAIFVGIHCHYANVALKIIRAETDCYTIALCSLSGHEDAMISLRDVDENKLKRFLEIAKEIKEGGK